MGIYKQRKYAYVTQFYETYPFGFYEIAILFLYLC